MDAWIEHCQGQEDPTMELIHEYVTELIEHKAKRLSGDEVLVRNYFKSKEFPEEPEVIADEIVNMIQNQPVLIEVYYLLAKNYFKSLSSRSSW